MPVGDVNSAERGSGARYNDGKPAMELIPVYIVGEIMSARLDGAAQSLSEALYFLAAFQRTHDRDYLLMAVDKLGDRWEVLSECAHVFTYGKHKYAAWNWAKGMAWSIPIGCIVRHAMAMELKGEVNDPESLLPHRGHIMCNLVMLLHFTEYYKEGNDLPPPELFKREPF